MRDKQKFGASSKDGGQEDEVFILSTSQDQQQAEESLALSTNQSHQGSTEVSTNKQIIDLSLQDQQTTEECIALPRDQAQQSCVEVSTSRQEAERRRADGSNIGKLEHRKLESAHSYEKMPTVNQEQNTHFNRSFSKRKAAESPDEEMPLLKKCYQDDKDEMDPGDEDDNTEQDMLAHFNKGQAFELPDEEMPLLIKYCHDDRDEIDVENLEEEVEDTEQDNLEQIRQKDRLKKHLQRQQLTVEKKQEITKQNSLQRRTTRRINKEKLSEFHRIARDPKANPEFYQLSEFNVKCVHCQALHFQEERPQKSKYPVDSLEDSFGDCCNYGKFSNLLDTIDEYPTALQELFSSDNKHHKNFISNIRHYNSAFACASLSCTRIDWKDTTGPPCFKIQGQVYHKFNPSAEPIEGVPTNGQIYYLDTKESMEALEQQSITEKCDSEVLNILNDYLHENYIYAKSYRMMKDVYREEEEKANRMGLPMPEVKMIFNIRKNCDKSRYNIPRAVCDANGEVPPSNMVVYKIGNKELINISPLESVVVPMTYPLFYPNNSKGWNINMMSRENKKISMCDYSKFHLFFRDNEKFIPHFYASKLFQQFVVDQAARIEWDRLCYLRTHQPELGRDSYYHLIEMLEKRAKDKSLTLEPHVILPSSFTQGPRNMHEHFMDAMSIVQETGKPDVFLTYTCNPTDPDIQKALIKEHAQYASDRPDIVARVFNLKRDKLLEELFVDQIFGKIKGHVWVIEYQKRGLPHMHLLFTLDTADKLHTKEDIDDMISCEIPNKEEEPVLYEVVTKNMIHGPCGAEFPNKVCWNKDKLKCDKKYPRQFRDETEVTENGYPFYKRPNNGVFIEKYVGKKRHLITNQNVVPYNVYLLKRFRAHINIEKVADVKAIKYIYKYVYKGYDKAIIECLKKGHLKYDEIRDYIEARYLSPCEACWRIFKFSFQGKSHSVEKLAIHLKNKQNVYYKKGATEEQIKKAMGKETSLTAYFKFHDEFPEARNEDGSMYLYNDMPKRCTWHSKERRWKPRKNRFNAIGRIYPVSPTNTELYYLRFLLLHTSAKSFIDLRTFNGIEYETYAKAALARGLVENDDEWKFCLEEAKHYQLPNKLRTLFANILIYCNPKDPEELWNLFKDELSLDIKRRFQNLDQEFVYQKTLSLIDRLLRNQEKSLQELIPNISLNLQLLDEEDFINTTYEQQEANKFISFMNEGQLDIYNEVHSSIESNEQLLLFIDGPGGTGKSFTLTAIYHMLRSKNLSVCNTAFSGIAATVLKKGRTLHNRFGLPLNVGKNDKSKILNSSAEAAELKKTHVIIWDEAPMVSKFVLDLIDDKLKELMKNDLPFGGKTFILSGDFRQCLPIQEFALRTEIVDLLIRNAKSWPRFKIKRLTQNMRADPEAIEFARDLILIGDGKVGKESYINLPDHCYVDGDLINEIFEDTLEKGNFEEMTDRVILSPFNVVVDQYNERIMEQFTGEFQTYLSADRTEENNPFEVSPEILNSFKHASLPDHELKLKRNCIIRLMRNLNVKEGLCNGTRMRVLNMGKNILQCEIITGDRKGEIEFIPRITLNQTEHMAFPIHRHQFPVKAAFSFTINKSQSQTFSRVGIDCRQEVFTHGQTYVALSRAKAWKGIKVKVSESNKEKLVKNIVFPEVLL